MKRVVILSEIEEITLQQLLIDHRHRDARTGVASLLRRGRKVKAKVIAQQLGVSDHSVRWAHARCDGGVCALMGGPNDGRPGAPSETMVATALGIARAEPLTLGQIAQRVQEIRGEALPSRIETRGEAIKREGCSFRCNRHVLKKSVANRRSP